MEKISQDTIVLNHLEENGSITTWEAYDMYGITRLSARIFGLRRAGYTITTKYVTRKNKEGVYKTFAKYELVEDEIETQIV